MTESVKLPPSLVPAELELGQVSAAAEEPVLG
jgi:hypothetical protein